jgi:hypothetical protein
MPRHIPEQWACEICGRKFAEHSDALECEQRGYFEYPKGLIFGNHDRAENHLYWQMTFAVADNHIEGHANYASRWACRTEGNDSLGPGKCGGGNSLRLSKHDANIDITHPTFIRLVDWLISAGISITVWDGEKAVPYHEYMKHPNDFRPTE